MTGVVFATIVRAGDLPLARSLAADLGRHHPHSTLYTLCLPAIDGAAVLAPAAGRAIGIGDVGLDPDQVALAQLTLRPEDLQMALAPVLCEWLLRTVGSPTLFLAPDTLVLAPLPQPRDTAIGVTARVLQLPDDDRTPTAAKLADMPAFDGGWLSATEAAAEPLLQATSTLWADGVPSTAGIAHVWNTLPARAPCEVIDDVGVGVAYWNIPERRNLVAEPGLPGVRSLRLPGFDPDLPYLISADQGDAPRVLLSEYPALHGVLRTHAERLRALGFRGPGNERVGDVEVNDHVRAAVALALRNDDETAARTAVGAILGGVDSLLHWLAASPPSAADDRISHYLLGVWASDDQAKALFPNPLDDHAESFVEWVRSHGVADAMPPRLRPSLTARRESAPAGATPDPVHEPGVNLVGFLRAGFGIGEATRLLAGALADGGVPHASISLNHGDLQDLVEVAGGADAPRFDTNLICVNVDWLDLVTRRLGADFMSSRYTIGTWWWESNVLPERLAQRIPEFDELWVGSRFIADALSAYAQIPIRVFPLPIPVPPEVPPPDRQELGLPDGFLFMFSFDFNSTVERKNPAGVINAFMRAFDPGEGPSLVIKTINGHRHLRALEELRELAAGRSDVIIVDRFLPAEERDAWARACDCYVSLHRCEGFGLTMAEAMALGKPVIATGYSANLDFMDASNSMLVGYDEWILARPSGPYPAGTRWAQPDLDEAAAHMRRLYEDPEGARALGARARAHIRATRTQDALARFVRGRLEEIRMTEHQEMEEAWDEPLPGPLQDAINYDTARRVAARGVKGRAVERLVKPYSAPTDAMIERLLATDEWVFTRGERRARAIERRLDEIERALARMGSETLVRLESETRLVEQRAQDELKRALDELSDRLYPTLYVNEPGGFMMTDDNGRMVMGFATGDGGAASTQAYADFEDVFRGPPERLAPGLATYVTLLKGHEPILDVGCGRGEMLDLLGKAGLEASGVDSDAGMVARARQTGLEVQEGDATEYLSDSVPAASLGAIFSAQVVEHIPWPALADFLTASHHALRPGGLFIAETVNPHCLQALKAFWLDPTHQHPLFPEAMLVFCRQAGFSRARIRFSRDADALPAAKQLSDSYAVIAEK